MSSELSVVDGRAGKASFPQALDYQTLGVVEGTAGPEAGWLGQRMLTTAGHVALSKRRAGTLLPEPEHNSRPDRAGRHPG